MRKYVTIALWFFCSFDSMSDVVAFRNMLHTLVSPQSARTMETVPVVDPVTHETYFVVQYQAVSPLITSDDGKDCSQNVSRETK